MVDPLKSAGAGTISCLFELPVGHVLDRIKTKHQTDQLLKHPIRTVMQNPYKGLSLNLANCLRAGSRWFTLPISRDLATTLLSDKDHLLAKPIAGAINAGFTTGLFNPVERLKVIAFSDGQVKDGFSSLWRGWRPSFAKQWMGSTVYLVAYDAFLCSTKKRRETLHWYDYALIGTMTGVTNGTCKKVLDVVNDQMKMQKSIGDERIIQTIISLYKKYGLQVFSRGLVASWARSGYYGGFTTACMYKMNALPEFML